MRGQMKVRLEWHVSDGSIEDELTSIDRMSISVVLGHVDFVALESRKFIVFAGLLSSLPIER